MNSLVNLISSKGCCCARATAVAEQSCDHSTGSTACGILDPAPLPDGDSTLREDRLGRAPSHRLARFIEGRVAKAMQMDAFILTRDAATAARDALAASVQIWSCKSPRAATRDLEHPRAT
jgi:hypothetical protein